MEVGSDRQLFGTGHTIDGPQEWARVQKTVDQFIHASVRGDERDTVNGIDSFSSRQAVERLTEAGNRWYDANGDRRVDLSYEFIASEGLFFTASSLQGFSSFNAQQKEYAQRALQSWADVANVNFVESGKGAGDGHLSFGNYAHRPGDGASGAFTFDPNLYKSETPLWFRVNNEQQSNLTPSLHDHGRYALVHEIGHALGLHHPHQGSGSQALSPYQENSRAYSVMSYTSERHGGHAFTKLEAPVYAFPSAPQMDDIAAIQKIYGANHQTRTGDTTYGFNANADRDFYGATSASDSLIFCIWDAGGVDTLDFSRYLQDQRINLNEGTFSDVGGLSGNVSIALGTVIEKAIGGRGNDVLIGNAADNALNGRQGDDIVCGGDGDDRLWGGAGNDILVGGAGADQMWGGEGRDVFVFTSLSDSPSHGPMDSIMDFTHGEDLLDVSQLSGHRPLSQVVAFQGNAGEVVFTALADGQKRLDIDFSGNGYSDFSVRIVGQMVIEDILS